MAQNSKKKTSKARVQESSTASVPSNDNLLWLMGFVMLVVGVISFCSVCSHFLHWSSDLSALRNNEELSGEVIPFENMCGRLGATLAYWGVDCSFGVFGIIIPIVITVLGWRIFRKKSLHLNHFALSAALLLVMGALTMGFIGTKFSLSYDIGGRLGHACAYDLSQIIGGFGMVVTLVAGWVLTGVFINRNFIHIVNGFSDTMVHQSERLATVVKDTVVKSRKENDAEQNVEIEEEEPLTTEPESAPASIPAAAPMSTSAYASTPVHNITINDSYAANSNLINIGNEESVAVAQSAQSVQPQMSTQPIHPISRPTEFVVEDEDEFYVESATPESKVVVEQSAEAQFDEDGFLVVPNVGAVPNKINVDVLLSKERYSEQNNRDQSSLDSSKEEGFDEDGFAVVSRDESGVGSGELAPAREVEYDFSTPKVAMPQTIAVNVDDEPEDGIVVTVRENVNLYDLNGREVKAPVRGIYVTSNGQKVLVK
jgi:hypothetical protein